MFNFILATTFQSREVTLFDIAELLQNAYLKVQCDSVAVNGFKCTGIYPFYPNVFADNEFLEGGGLTAADKIPAETTVSENQQTNKSTNPQTPLQISTSTTVDTITATQNMEQIAGCNTLSQWDISPVPVIGKNNRIGKGTTVSTILTDTPYKNALEDSIQKKNEKELKKITKKLSLTSKDQTFGKKKTAPKKKTSVKRK